MHRRIDGENKAEDQKASDERCRQPFRRLARGPSGSGQQERDRHQNPRPENGLAGGLCLGLALGAEQPGRKGLHRAIGDDPEREETADQEERLTPPLGCPVRQDCLEIDGDADHEPYVARAEQEHPRKG